MSDTPGRGPRDDRSDLGRGPGGTRGMGRGRRRGARAGMRGDRQDGSGTILLVIIAIIVIAVLVWYFFIR